MKKIVECVPNFSEGKDKAILDQIVAEINSVEGSQVVDVDMGADADWRDIAADDDHVHDGRLITDHDVTADVAGRCHVDALP